MRFLTALTALFKKPTGTRIPVIDAYRKNKPNFFYGLLSGSGWRHKSIGGTLNYISDKTKLNNLQAQARNNLIRWSKQKSEPPYRVEVVNEDWGTAAENATKQYGKPYAILNMANPRFPGGAFLEGGSAQEENLWHRSTCARSLSSKGIKFAKEDNSFLYTQKRSRLLNGLTKMNNTELSLLSSNEKDKTSSAYKVLMSPKPDVCFRGPEIYAPEPEMARMMVIPDLSFSYLPKERIFPFYELRSAAPDISGININKANNSLLSEYKKILTRRIGAQLDTLIARKCRNLTLGAWGCGCFKNNPHIVSEIYRNEIAKRAKHFDHIIFPIKDYGTTNNYSVFKEALDGMKLRDLEIGNQQDIKSNFFKGFLQNSQHSDNRSSCKTTNEESHPSSRP
jgi:hypothetical protein